MGGALGLALRPAAPLVRSAAPPCYPQHSAALTRSDCRRTALNAEFCGLKDGDLAALPATLLTLNLNGAREISDAGIDTATRACPQLQTLELYWNGRLTSRALEHVAARCADLRRLNLSGCKSVTDSGLQALARQGGGRLASLDLTRCPGVSAAGVAAVVRANPSLTSFNLYATPGMDDAVCAAIGESLQVRPSLNGVKRNSGPSEDGPDTRFGGLGRG